MKQLIQSYKSGELGIFEVPPPACMSAGVLVRTVVSLVSAGTEKMIVNIAKKSLLGKAKARPDLVKQVLIKMKQEGIKNTLNKVFTKLDTPIPLGYSCAGIVIETGRGVEDVTVGARVACGGAGYASHSEVNYIPKNLFVKIPENVDDIEAAFITVGAIALQGVRQAGPLLGECVAVIGLGLIGQITVQLLKANGCRVLGIDIAEDKLQLAKRLGADIVCRPENVAAAASELSGGFGVDSTIITASASNSQPVIDAGTITRHKGKVVVVGLVGMDIPRDIYYKKELDLRLSMAYGPGRYDPVYEEKGIDYPYSYVRWTEQRNFEAFLGLVATGKVTPRALITHEFNFVDALKAYDLLSGKTKESYLGIVLEYPESASMTAGPRTILAPLPVAHSSSPTVVTVGMIGAGNFAKAVILPIIKRFKDVELIGLCTATGVSAYSVGQKYQFHLVTTDASEIINNRDINTVVITTRHNTHAENVVKALSVGKHVFVEKPLCINESELEEIRSVYSSLFTPHSTPPLLMVGFNRRFSPFARKMRETIGDAAASIMYRINAGVIPKDSWIQDPEVGAGRIVGEVCHFIDTCSYLLGSLPSTVSAVCVRKADRSIPDEDNVTITLTYLNGSTALINYTAYGNRQVPKEQIEVFSNDLFLRMDDFRELAIFKGNERRELIRRRGQDKGFSAEFETFTSAIRGGEIPIDFGSIYATTRATFKILESLRTGQPATV
ncbi:MAG: bi-domain-containing oxidoreductase [Syntrophorhabdaceae bacterium]